MLRNRTVITAALTLVLAACNGEEKASVKRVRILATTDEHSHLLAAAPEKDEWPLPSSTTVRDGALKGGIARRATVLERERADGVPTVLLSNGDYSQGTLSAVAYTVANFDAMLMKKLGYDAVALGNHEFDLGPAAAAAAVTRTVGGAPQLVLTNAIFSSTSTADDALAAIYGGVGSGKPIVSGVVVDKGGVKVGVVSALSPSAAYDVQYQAAPVTFSTASLTLDPGAVPPYDYTAYVGAATASIATLLRPVITDLRSRGAEVVVLLFHGGLASTGTNGDADYLVPLLRGVDLVVTGHTHGLPPTGTELIADADARQVPVMQPAPYGNQVLRAEFVVENGQARFDAGRDAFLAVDDSVPPTADQEIRSGISTALSSIESSVLPGTLTAVLGRSVGDNPLVVGDLYFYPLGTTTFDVTGATLPGETNALNLDTDAMLTVTKALGYTTTVALQNAGSIRGDLAMGDTGTLAFADVYRMVSLGGDPFDTPQGPGYPLIHAYVVLAELRAAFELTFQMAGLNNDYYLGSSGLAINWSPSRAACTTPVACAAGPGWITRLATMDGSTELAVYYDLALNPATGWLVDPTTVLIPVVTPYLVAAFAGKMGVTLRDSVGTPVTDLSTLVVEWTGPGTPSPSVPNVKDHQALGAFINSPLFGLGGVIPSTYDAAVPVRAVCTTTDPVNHPCP